MKWDHEVTAGEDISSVLREAYRVASTEPCGPVYLSFAGGVLMGNAGKEQVLSPVGDSIQALPEEEDAALDTAATMLANAENPLIMSAYAGRHPEAVKTLVQLAELLGARTITTDLRMNFPSTHPLCPGIDAIKGNEYDHFIEEADVLLLVDYAFPGPVAKEPAPGKRPGSFKSTWSRLRTAGPCGTGKRRAPPRGFGAPSPISPRTHQPFSESLATIEMQGTVRKNRKGARAGVGPAA